MYRIFLILCTFFVLSPVYALEIQNQSVKKAPPRASQNIFGEIDPQSYVDFGTNVQAVKKHHFIEIFPDFYENHVVQIPEKTPEYLFLENILGATKMQALVSFGYDFNREKREYIRPIRLFQNNVKWTFSERNPEKGFATNTQNTIYYQLSSPRSQTITVKVFPATDRDNIFFYNYEYETFAFEHPELVQIARPELKTQAERDAHVKKEYQFPTITMLDTTMDMYDLELQTSQDDFQTVHADWNRKMVWTHFGKDFVPPMGEGYDDGKKYTMLKDLFTFLPYYETHISVPKGDTTVVLSYKNLQMTDGSLTVPIQVEK